MTWRDLTSSFVDMTSGESIENIIKSKWTLDEVVMSKLAWLGIFDNNPIEMEKGSPAVALQKLIEKKWKLNEGDKDMIVMWHRFIYSKNGKRFEKTSSLVTLGDDTVYTAMSKTVGLPIAIAARMILNGKMPLSGVRLPIIPEIYLPVLEELKQYGIVFNEQERELN
jgi:saccharopine dehydrogenase-like NADP-dependent oxidoreductase